MSDDELPCSRCQPGLSEQSNLCDAHARESLRAELDDLIGWGIANGIIDPMALETISVTTKE